MEKKYINSDKNKQENRKWMKKQQSSICRLSNVSKVKNVFKKSTNCKNRFCDNGFKSFF